jgi:hypothetical protein
MARNIVLRPSPEAIARPWKERGKARAMTNILAAQSVEKRAKGESMIQQADKLLCELERADVVRRRSVADYRPGDQRGLSVA